MAEFAVVLPLTVLLLAGLVMAGLYAWRAASADTGVFMAGVGTGSYNEPATDQGVSASIWSDIRAGISAEQTGERTVQSLISIEDSRKIILGVNFVEVHRGGATFRLWRFFPGPPPAGGYE